MSKYATLIAQIAANIRRNGAQAITGDLLQEQLLAMITSLGEYYQFGGLASPSAEFTPGDEPVVFVAATPGTYTNFGGLVVADGEVALLVWSGSAWSKQTTDIATRTEVSQLGQKIEETELEYTSIQQGYINSDGSVTASAAFCITNDIQLYAGDKIKAKTGSQGFAIIAKHAEIGATNPYIQLMPSSINQWVEYTAEEDMIVVCCGLYNNANPSLDLQIAVYRYNSVSRQLETINEQLSNCLLVKNCIALGIDGKGNTTTQKEVKLIDGRTYRLVFDQTNWQTTSITGSNVVFALDKILNEVSSNLFVVRGSEPTVNKEYEFNAEENDYYRIIVKSDVGEVVHFSIVDITDSKRTFPLFVGKNISVVGDSISTFKGYNGANPYYYPQGDVTTVTETWWYKLIEKTNSTIKENNSASGGSVCAIQGRTSLISNVSSLESTDILFLAGGVNDSIENIAIGQIDFSKATNELDETQFAEAYDKYVRIARTKASRVYIIITSEIQEKYIDIIKQIANHYNIQYIDLSTISSIISKVGVSVHPNKSGMEIMTEFIVTDLFSLSSKQNNNLDEISSFVDFSLNKKITLNSIPSQNYGSHIGYVKLVSGKRYKVEVVNPGWEITDIQVASTVILAVDRYVNGNNVGNVVLCRASDGYANPNYTFVADTNDYYKVTVNGNVGEEIYLNFREIDNPVCCWLAGTLNSTTGIVESSTTHAYSSLFPDGTRLKITLKRGWGIGIYRYKADGTTFGSRDYYSNTGYDRVLLYNVTDGTARLLFDGIGTTVDTRTIDNYIKVEILSDYILPSKLNCGLILNRRTVVSDAKNYLCGDASFLLADGNNGMAYVGYSTSETGYGEQKSIIALSVFPICQPFRAEYFEIMKVGTTYGDYTFSNFRDINFLMTTNYVRVFFSGYIGGGTNVGWYYMDFDKLTKTVSNPVPVYFKKPNSDTALLLNKENWQAFYTEENVDFNEDSSPAPNSNFVLEDGRFYTNICTLSDMGAHCGYNALAYTDDNGATFKVVSIIPYGCEYESQMAFDSNGKLFIIQRGNAGSDMNYKQLVTSSDNGATYQGMNFFVIGSTRPQMLKYDNKLLVCTPLENWMDSDYVKNDQRAGFVIRIGNGTDTKDYKEIIRLYSADGLLYYSILNYKGTLYATFVEGGLYPDKSGNRKDKVSFCKIGKIDLNDNLIID